MFPAQRPLPASPVTSIPASDSISRRDCLSRLSAGLLAASGSGTILTGAMLTGSALTSSVLSPSQRLLASEQPRAYKVLGEDGGRVSLVDAAGQVEWQYECKAQCHDLWMLPSGNVLLAIGPATVAEVSPQKEIVWKYQSQPPTGYTGPIEVHAFQPLADGKVMIAESGPARIIEVNRQGQITHQIPLKVEHPHPHRDTRMARKLSTGHYLVCHEADGAVREYNPSGKVVWEYRLNLFGRPRSGGHGPEGHGTEVFGAIRLPNGRTLIGGGNNNSVLEVDPQGRVTWSLHQTELPGIVLAWVTMIEALPNGNIIVGNCHAGDQNPQLFEVTRDKQVVWQFKNFQTFNNSLAATHLLGTPAGTIR